ncbi:MAG: CoA ester lyase [Parvularculaceae bacterium]|nr:CoA ester lyase [Parvularculaceae bacterium]
MTYRSLLFVPGARPDRFEKALAAGADAVAIDLEDAVAPPDKATARRETLAFLGRSRPGLGLRINALSTLDGFRDVVALAESGASPAFLMIPKASGADELLQLRAVLGEASPPLFPLMETAEALYALPAMARVIGPAGALVFGGADYSAAIGSDMGPDALAHARAAIVAAAALSGCGTLDVPHLDVKDALGLKAGTERAKAMGFTGRACIHPDQVPVVNAVFTPTADEIARAEKVKAAYAAAGGGVALLDGKLIERPVLRAAERVLARKGK